MSLNLGLSIALTFIGLLGIGGAVAFFLFPLSEDPRGPAPHRDDE